MAKMSKPAMPKGMPPKGMPPKGGMHMMGGKMMSDAEMQKMHGSPSAPSAKKGKK